MFILGEGEIPLFISGDCGIFLLAINRNIMIGYLTSFIMYPPLLASGGKLPLSIVFLAGAAVLFLLFLIFKPLSRGIMDVFGYYQSNEIIDWWLNKFFYYLIVICLTLIIFFPPLLFGGEYLWTIVILEFLILILFFIYILRSIHSGVIKYRKNILNGVFSLLILITIFQILFKSTLIPYQTFFRLKLISLYFALFVVITNFVRHKEEIDDIISKIMIAGTFISCVAILQVFTGASKIYWAVQPRYPNYFGPFEYVNHFACYVPMVAFLTLGSLCVNILRGKEVSFDLPPKQMLSNILSNVTDIRVFSRIFCFSIMVMALVLTKSRAGIFGFLIVFILFISFMLRHRYSKKIILTLLTGIFIVGTILGFLLLSFVFMGIEVDLGINGMLKELSTVYSFGEYILRARLFTMDGLKIFGENPFFGIGLGSTGDILPLYVSVVPVHGWGMTPEVYHIAVVTTHLFNDVLQLLIEAGLIGFIILLVPFSIFIVKLVAKIDKTKSEYKYLIGMGCLSSLLFLGLHIQLNFNMSLSAISSLFTILLSISLLVINLRPGRGNLEIGMETKEIIELKSAGSKIFFYVLSTLIFIYLAFIVSKPLIVNNLIRDGATFSSFNKALAMDPKNDKVYYHYQKFIIRKYKEDYIAEEEAFNTAEAMINKAIELNPYKTSYLIAKGDLKLLQGDYEEASSLYKKASLMEPNNAFIQMGYAVVLFWQAIHEEHLVEKKDILMKKGLLYYNKARTLSNNLIKLRSVVRDTRVHSLLMESLKKEGINIL